MKLSNIFRIKSGRDVIQESTEFRSRKQLNIKVDLRLREYPHQAEDIEGDHDAEDYIPQPLV